MARENRRGDISKDSQSQMGQILFWFFVIVLSALLFFFILWFMFRVNYKLNQVRENFWPVVGRSILILLLIILLFALFTFTLNALSRRSYKTEDDDE